MNEVEYQLYSNNNESGAYIYLYDYFTNYTM